MNGAWLARARWRWRGAMLWPTFIVAVVLDAVIVHAWPLAGGSQSFFGGLLIGLILSLLALLACSRPLGSLLRRRRGDLPVAIARDYAGTVGVLAVTVVLLIIGLRHHSSIVAQERTLDDAVARAEAFIGDRAPAEFRVNAYHADVFTIQAGSLYRICVPSRDATRSYCVIVKEQLPFAQSVVPAGYEPNALFAEGVN
ncbi:MAG: hypothetical protein ACLP50_27840 [Solirubrobacteraceae bacterium]